MNILLIDDEANLLKMLRRPLTKCGHSITEAQNGRQGWKLFVEYPNRFDVIVTDIRMPVLDGLTLLKQLREKEYDIPVIIMTGYEDIHASIEVLRLGAFDFLLKPFEARDLIQMLDKLEAIQANRKKEVEALPFFTENIEIAIPSETKLISAIKSFLQDRMKSFCKLHKIDERKLNLCLHEALINAVIHGNLEIPSELKAESDEKFDALVREREANPAFSSRQVQIKCQVTTEGLTFEIQDEGRGFDLQIIKQLDPLQMVSHGRGILIILSFMDQVGWNETGNKISMMKKFQRRNE